MPVIGQWFCLIVYLSQWIERTVFKLRFFVPSVIAMPVIGRWQMGGRLIVWDYAEKRTVQSQATETDPNTATYNMHIQIYRDKVYCMRLCMQRKVQSSATETDTNTDTDTNALHIHIHYRLLVSETMQRQEQFKAQQYLCISFLKAFRFALL